MAASLSDFWAALEHCFTVIPAWRNSERLRHYIEGYRQLVTHLVHLLSTRDGDKLARHKDDEQVMTALALELSGGWLRDWGDEPFEVIALVNVALSEVFMKLASACKAKGVDFVLPKLEDVCVLVPSRDALMKVLANWTCEELQGHGAPGDKVAVEVRDKGGSIEVVLYTRFGGKDVSPEKISTGSGASELLDYDFSLFGAKLLRVDKSPTFEGELFDVGIAASFGAGLSLRSREAQLP